MERPARGSRLENQLATTNDDMTSRRNVLFITADQWRGDFLPWARAPFLRLPTLESLARDAVVFQRHYSVTSPCGPARASLLTGLYQMNHRAVQNTIPLDARHTNIAKEVRKSGYDPVLVGYTTTTPDPRTTGPADPRFTVLGDVMEGFRPLANLDPYPMMHDYFRWMAGKGFALPPNHHDVWLPQAGAPGPTAAPARLPAELSDTAWVTDVALSYLEDHRSAPWFLHLCYWRPHPPFIAPEPYSHAFREADMPEPVRAASVADEAAQHALVRFYLEHTKNSSYFHGAPGRICDLDVEAIRQTRATYCGLIAEVDHHLGRIFEFLRRSGQWDDTLIVFTSDHGELLGDHYQFGKSGYFDPIFHVPLVIRDPSAKAGRGAAINAFTESVDVVPTILDWIGAPVPRTCDGRSLAPWCRAEPPASWRTEAHFEFDFRDLWYIKPETALGIPMDLCCLAGVRDEHHKYVHFAALPPLFFDLGADPNEMANRASDPAAGPSMLDLAQKMLSWRLEHAERTLTGYRASPQGLEARK
jgi:arylsulfatase A-like enzyme